MAFQSGSTTGLPTAAISRLQSMRGTGAKARLFSSDLSVNEFYMVKHAGFSPIGMVMGSSIYHIGLQFANVFSNGEMEVMTQAMYQARELAMTRMEEEAAILGADGVVGVRLEVKLSPLDGNLAEFQAVGTAIKHDGGGKFTSYDGRPFTSDLSGQDFWMLLKSGFRPLALTMGTCVYYIGAQGFRNAFKTLGRNIEMENYTQAYYEARELAIGRMVAEAERENAVGIVGNQVSEQSFGWGTHMIEFFSVGTAVAEYASGTSLPDPAIVFPSIG